MDTGHEDGRQQGKLFSSLSLSLGTKVKTKWLLNTADLTLSAVLLNRSAFFKVIFLKMSDGLLSLENALHPRKTFLENGVHDKPQSTAVFRRYRELRRTV